MPANHLEASVRQERGGTVLDLRGEINGFAQEALNAAYAEAEAKDPGAILLRLSHGLAVHQLSGCIHPPDRGAVYSSQAAHSRLHRQVLLPQQVRRQNNPGRLLGPIWTRSAMISSGW